MKIGDAFKIADLVEQLKAIESCSVSVMTSSPTLAQRIDVAWKALIKNGLKEQIEREIMFFEFERG